MPSFPSFRSNGRETPLESLVLSDDSKRKSQALGTLLFSLTPSMLRNNRAPTDQHPRIRVKQQLAHRRGGSFTPRMGDDAGALARPGTQLDDVLNALPPDEKYNTVLMSLLTKETSSTDAAINLVREMTSKRLRLSGDALKKLLDVTIEKGVMEDIMKTLNAACDNGACSAFASRQIRFPNKPNQNVLNSLSQVPSDDRGTEVGVALGFTLGLGALSLDELANILDFWNVVDAPPLGGVIIGLIAGWAGDRYANQGAVSDLIGRGVSRLFSRDVQRESSVESASFLIGYLLGLPCCAFSPSASKPLDMLVSVAGDISTRVGGSGRLIDRVLIWLMAPAALEMSEYKGMISSNPSLGREFLQAARRREASIGIDVEEGGWSSEEDDQRIRWAYSEARRLLQQYSGLRKELEENMVAGISAGDCANLIEGKLKNAWAMI